MVNPSQEDLLESLLEVNRRCAVQKHAANKASSTKTPNREIELEKNMKQILVGFHAVQARLRVDPDSLKSVYFDPSRRDRRMGDFLKQAEELLGERLHAADAERLHKLAGHDRHQGVVALAEKMTIARTIT